MKFVDSKNIFKPLPPVFDATDRSKEVVPVLFLILCSFVIYTKGAVVNVLKFSRALCPRFSVCFSILITSLGEEGAGLCASRTFNCVFCACIFLSFSLPLGVGGWLRLVIVAYPSPFY